MRETFLSLADADPDDLYYVAQNMSAQAFHTDGVCRSRQRRRRAASILRSNLLRQWHDGFPATELQQHARGNRFLQKLVLLRLCPKNSHKIAPAAIEVAKRLHVGLLFF